MSSGCLSAAHPVSQHAQRLIKERKISQLQLSLFQISLVLYVNMVLIGCNLNLQHECEHRKTMKQTEKKHEKQTETQTSALWFQIPLHQPTAEKPKLFSGSVGL